MFIVQCTRFGDIYRIICLNCMVTLPLRRKKNRIIFGNQICVKLHWNGCFLSKHFRSWRQSSGVDKKMSCRENEPFSFVMESGIIKFIYNLFIFHQLEEIIMYLQLLWTSCFSTKHQQGTSFSRSLSAIKNCQKALLITLFSS